MMSFWFQTGSRAPGNGCRITAWHFFLSYHLLQGLLKVWRYLEVFQQPVSSPQSLTEQIPSIPTGISTITVSQMEFSLSKKGLASGNVEQQCLQEWRKSTNQTSTLPLIKLQETLVHHLSCLLILPPGSPLCVLFRQLICNKVLLQSPSKSLGQPLGYWWVHFFSCQDAGWPPHFLAACLMVSRKAKFMQLQDPKLPNIQKCVWAAAAPKSATVCTLSGAQLCAQPRQCTAFVMICTFQHHFPVFQVILETGPVYRLFYV